MKKLIFVRHAKSSWEYDVTDRKRPLKKRGYNDAKLVSTALAKYQIKIDKIYSSPAKRAFTTCEIFSKNLNKALNDIEIKEDLYDFGGQNVQHFIGTLDDDYETVLLFGHNHAFTSLVNLYGDKYIDNLPTSGAVVIEFEALSWQYIKLGQTKLILFPRDFK